MNEEFKGKNSLWVCSISYFYCAIVENHSTGNIAKYVLTFSFQENPIVMSYK